MALIRRIEIGPDSVKIDVGQDRLAALLSSNELDISHDGPINPQEHVVTLTAPVQLRRVGREMKLLVDDSSDNRAPDMSLLRVVTRAHDVQRRLAEDTTLTVHDIAREQRVTPKYLYILLRLRWLAPDITTAIVNGRQPLTAQCHALDAADCAVTGRLVRTTRLARLSLGPYVR